jgi:hypothetical protein
MPIILKDPVQLVPASRIPIFPAGPPDPLPLRDTEAADAGPRPSGRST